MAIETLQTLSYSDGSKGWPSFYTFFPDYMIGMNSYFYSFKGGNLFRHNTNSLRNNYYGIQGSSSITSVLNNFISNVGLGLKTLVMLDNP